jgi:hypothetical protein
MIRYLTLYKLTVNNGEDEVRCGVLSATSFTDAMRQIEDYYGSELITIQFMEMYDADHMTFGANHFDTVKAMIMEEFV